MSVRDVHGRQSGPVAAEALGAIPAAWVSAAIAAVAIHRRLTCCLTLPQNACGAGVCLRREGVA
jgi:hypothetical protein